MRSIGLALGVLALGLVATQPARAQAIEKPDVTLAVGGKSGLYYLPLTITERLGYFKQQGLDVTIDDFAGGAKSLQALLGGSVDVVTGAYEHTIRMQARGQDIKAVLELGRFPGFVLGVRKEKAGSVKSFKDLKGFKIGVSAPGSATHFFVNALIGKDGLKPEDVSIISVGSGATAVAAIKRGEIDAISNVDPAVSKLEQDGDIVVLADTRTEEGNMQLFGGTNPAAVLYLKADFAEKYPNTTQRLVNALYGGLQWLKTASMEDVVKTMPEEYYLGDRTLYERAVKASIEMYSRTGVITEKGMQNAYQLLAQFDPELKGAKVDLAKTFDDRFVRKAAAGM
ncbi:MAG TPA: ABC transporter substrate-binding protein [Xanthobacteraceae bacterium]|nr:ABC transporter substrate-binding protein [Xanthobacteraceae bacterium]